MKRHEDATAPRYRLAAKRVLSVLLAAACALALACGGDPARNENGGANAGGASANSVTPPAANSAAPAANSTNNAAPANTPAANTGGAPAPAPAITPRTVTVNPSSGTPANAPTPRATPSGIRAMPGPGKNPRADRGLENRGQGHEGHGGDNTARPAPEKRAKCGDKTCPAGQVCCNTSCGICTPPGGVCIQMVCDN